MQKNEIRRDVVIVMRNLKFCEIKCDYIEYLVSVPHTLKGVLFHSRLIWAEPSLINDIENMSNPEHVNELFLVSDLIYAASVA